MKLPSFLRRKPKNPDLVMRLALDGDDWLDLHQCYSNIFITGQIGSAKTTGVGANLAHGLLSHPSRPAAWVVCQKPDEGARWLRYAEQAGRLGDVIHVTPGGKHRIDILEHEVSTFGGGVEQAKSLLGVLMEVANRNRQRNSADSFWPESAEMMMGHSMHILKKAGHPCGLKNLLLFCQSLPNSPEQLKDPAWRVKSYSVNCLMAAAKLHPEDDVLQMSGDWMTGEWPTLSDKTRSIVYSVSTITISKLLTNQFADLLNGTSTFTPEKAMEEGKIVIWDTPGSVFGPPAQLASVAIKLLFQRAAMRRDLSKPCRPLILWCDEAANFCVPDLDAMFLSQSRQFKCICCNIVQNLPLVVTALGANEAARHQAQAWISNHSTIIGCANSDPETNKLLSALAGEEKETMYGGSGGTQQNFDPLDDFMGRSTSHAHASWSEQYRPALPPEWFLGLAKGGKPHFTTEAYVFQSGRIFNSTGRTWMRGSWKQRF
jgi:hypothetical protein